MCIIISVSVSASSAVGEQRGLGTAAPTGQGVAHNKVHGEDIYVFAPLRVAQRYAQLRCASRAGAVAPTHICVVATPLGALYTALTLLLLL